MIYPHHETSLTMKPILVLQHAHYDWPAYFTDCLINWEIPFELINVAAGDTLPLTITDYSGFGVMGGGMSANDDVGHPHLIQTMALIEEAVEHRIPVIGHCLGGAALGACIGRHRDSSPLP